MIWWMFCTTCTARPRQPKNYGSRRNSSTKLMTLVQDLQVLIHEIHAEGMTVSETFQVVAIIKKLPPSWVDFKNYLKHKRKEMSVEDLIVRLLLRQKEKEKKKNDKKGNGKAKAVDNGEKLYMSNSVTADIKGEGDVILKMTSEKELKLTNVFKDEAIDKFVLYKTEVENQLGRKIKVVRSDRGVSCLKSLPTKGGDKYFIMFIDDCTKYCYVYLLKSKDEAIDKFVLYKTEVENQLGRKIKVVRSDRGGEYVSSFAELCVKHGIRHEFTAPYSPQQNGIAERKNRTLKEMVNAMLISSGLSQDMWREAILTATYLLNKIPYIQKNAIIESRNASFFENIFPCLSKETGSSSRLDDEVVQEKRQRDDNDLHDERQDQLDNDKMIKSTKDMLKSQFDMKDMGLADVILGIKIIRTHNGLVLSQAHYVDKILNIHNAWDFDLATTPIDTGTRHDLAYAVSRLSRYTSNPSVAHWKAMTRVLYYLRYSRDYGLHYDIYHAVIEGYSNANWISDIKDSRSTSEYMFTLGGAAISWKSSMQTIIAKSTMELEFIALDKCGEETKWLCQFVEDIPRWLKQSRPKPRYVLVASYACFNKATRIVNHTNDMIMGKWDTMNGACQKFNAVFKRCERNRKSGESPANLTERTKQFREEPNTGNKKINLERAWRILKECSKWDAPDPANLVDLTELFGDDARPRPVGKPRPAEKNKLDGTASTAGSGKSSTLFETLHSEFKLKREAAEKAYETRKQ
nr:retrotransposon protein, putative, Ty1-copia subclass [Tanacetum cinerariifolium]